MKQKEKEDGIEKEEEKDEKDEDKYYENED